MYRPHLAEKTSRKPSLPTFRCGVVRCRKPAILNWMATFPAAEVQIEFLDPADEGDGDAGGSMFPTGNPVDTLEVPGVGTLRATLINAGIPPYFVEAEAIGYSGWELQEAINGDSAALTRFEAIRAYGALRMGLIKDLSEAAARQHT